MAVTKMDPNRFRPGDRVECPTGSIAYLFRLREDGRWDADYEDEPPHLCQTILDPKYLKKLQPRTEYPSAA